VVQCSGSGLHRLGKTGAFRDDVVNSKSFHPTSAVEMPATFDSFGLKFLYPDNWSRVDSGEAEEHEGVTLELPSGGFFSIEREMEGQLADELIEEIASSFETDYGEVEREELPFRSPSTVERAVEFRFYYLDLLIISRMLILGRREKTYVIQMQAESRDFESNEMVFNAILKQLDA
jgi:hypothetical protein